jgi:hypothetical protein
MMQLWQYIDSFIYAVGFTVYEEYNGRSIDVCLNWLIQLAFMGQPPYLNNGVLLI